MSTVSVFHHPLDLNNLRFGSAVYYKNRLKAMANVNPTI